MAEKSYLNYVPPGALRDVAQTGYQLLDNIIGFDDDYDTTGELLSQSLARDPLGTTKAIGSGVVDAAKAAYDEGLIGTIGNIKDEFVDAFTFLNTPLPEDATREQMGQHLEAASVLATLIPGYKGVQAVGRSVVGGVDNAPSSQVVFRRDDVFRGNGPARVSETVATSTDPFAVRVTGQSQIDDMIDSGLIRPKKGGYGKKNSPQIYFGTQQTNTINPDSPFTGLGPGKEFALVGRPGQISQHDDGIPIDALEHIWTRKGEKLVDVLPDILKQNRGPR